MPTILIVTYWSSRK